MVFVRGECLGLYRKRRQVRIQLLDYDFCNFVVASLRLRPISLICSCLVRNYERKFLIGV